MVVTPDPRNVEATGTIPSGHQQRLAFVLKPTEKLGSRREASFDMKASDGELFHVAEVAQPLRRVSKARIHWCRNIWRTYSSVAYYCMYGPISGIFLRQTVTSQNEFAKRSVSDWSVLRVRPSGGPSLGRKPSANQGRSPAEAPDKSQISGKWVRHNFSAGLGPCFSFSRTCSATAQSGIPNSLLSRSMLK